MDAIVGIPYTFTSREMLQPLWLIETKGDLDGVMSRKSVALASSNQLKRNRPMPDAYGCKMIRVVIGSNGILMKVTNRKIEQFN